MKILKKEIDISESSKEGARLLSEKKIYQSISNPYIVKLHFSFQSKTKIYMILDFMNGGDLFYHILSCRKIKEKRAVRIASQVLLALK
jgi:serine/threonine protein kinase